MKILDWNSLSVSEQSKLLDRCTSNNDEIVRSVKNILENVRCKGDKALFELTEKYDKTRLDSIRVSDEEFELASIQVQSRQDELAAIKSAIQRIEEYQRYCMPKEIKIDTEDGIVCRRIPKAIESVGLYVPGGTAPLVSTLMMLAIPAKLAACKTRVLCTPPNKDGSINPLLLETAKLCGINLICKVGGAQAIAALAYGTESVPSVDKIFGPGNAWVTSAKQIVAQDPIGAAIDMPAGPSEVMVIADEQANPEFVAADLLSQAEHGPDSQCILVTVSRKLADAVNTSLKKQQTYLSRKDIIQQSLANSCIVLVENMEQAIEVSNQYAPEHLIVQADSPESYLNKIKNAGAVFLGPWCPESLGDYSNGANHVLPTNGNASCFSGLSASDFMKYISVQSVTRAGLKTVAPIASALAEIEGLDAHEQAINIRLNSMRTENE